MDQPRTLAIDIGGSGIKCALLDDRGRMLGERIREPTPEKPVGPAEIVRIIAGAAARLGQFDRASVGFPGAVRAGRVLTAPNLGTELWGGFDLEGTLEKLWRKPVRVMNDADVQGFGAIGGKGLEMVLTLGTGAGTALFYDGKVLPHLELSHHPIKGNDDYDGYVGRAVLDRKGPKAWSKRVERLIGVLRTVTNFDHLYIGGGNAKQLDLKLPPDVTIVSNKKGLVGGIALWRDDNKIEQPAANTRRRTAGASAG